MKDSRTAEEIKEKRYYQSFFLGKELFEQVSKMADHWKVSKNYIVRVCIAGHIKKLEKELK